MAARIGLHDSDRTGFPNLALMKLSAYYKKLGADVDWYLPLKQYDRVFSSKVFTFTPEELHLPDCTVKGGTGYGLMDVLPEHIDTIFPDYSLYPDCKHAIGFLTRGCIRNCPWCIVPKKKATYGHTWTGVILSVKTAGISCSWTITFSLMNTG